jgi:hypothetical protein
MIVAIALIGCCRILAATAGLGVASWRACDSIYRGRLDRLTHRVHILERVIKSLPAMREIFSRPRDASRRSIKKSAHWESGLHTLGRQNCTSAGAGVVVLQGVKGCEGSFSVPGGQSRRSRLAAAKH